MVVTTGIIALCCSVFLPVSIYIAANAHGIYAAPANCSRTCSGDPGLNSSTVNYPFGSSSGCPIQLSCNGNGEFLVGEFPVLSVTADAITINIPVDCGRPFSRIDQLFRSNLSPTYNNAILLNNCTQSSSCRLPITMVRVDTLGKYTCKDDGGTTTNQTLSCYSENVDNSSSFLSLNQLKSLKCQYFLSSISSNLSYGDSVAVDAQMMQLGWWLEGDCKCSKNANCTRLSVPPSGMKGYRCRCRDGFVGDGFLMGGGCRSRDDGKKKPLLSVYIVVPVISLMLIVVVISCCYWRGRILRIGLGETSKQDQDTRLYAAFEELNSTNKSGSRINKDNELHFFSFSAIKCATDNFSSENKLGQGGFGPVYKGTMENGQEIAVKRLSQSSGQGVKEFINEVILISKLQHRNLVRLIGCCIDREEKLLIYEYMPNKSLDSFIFDATQRVLLDWSKRFCIMEGIAQGLLYLHNDLNPKISDFGTARIFGDNESRANTNRIVGTYGYMSPEYAMDGLFSVKSDVFSYGVMMLEVISGKKNTGFYHANRFINLLGYAWNLWKEGSSLELMDPELEQTSSITNEVIRCIQIALLCVQENAVDRPTMSDVGSMLTYETITLPTPKQPAFFLTESGNEEHSIQEAAPYSVTKVTISDVTGR